MKISQRIISGAALCLGASYVLAQSTAKELFIGLDGKSTQLPSKGTLVAGTPGPAIPARPKVLGLQTTIYQVFDDGGVKAVSPSTIFAGGSRIRLGFNANKAGFLYIVNLGTSGKITTIFPTANTDNNQVQPGLVYQIPQQTGRSIRFDTTPGDEVLLVVLAESRISEFEYGGQRIAISSPNRGQGTQAQSDREQRITMASLDLKSTSRDLFVEDDGVFQTVVFNPASEASRGQKPLVTAIKLAHR